MSWLKQYTESVYSGFKLYLSWLINSPSSSSSSSTVISFNESDQRRKASEEVKAVLALRSPQKNLDSRIVALLKGRLVSNDEAPILGYGLVFFRQAMEECIKRNGIKVEGRGTPEYNEQHDEQIAQYAVQRFLEERCDFDLQILQPLAENDDLYLISLDDTLVLSHMHYSRGEWKEEVKPVLKIIREELDLGDQKAMWWWDSRCGVGYICPISDYNTEEDNGYLKSMRAYQDSIARNLNNEEIERITATKPKSSSDSDTETES